jgi:transposase
LLPICGDWTPHWRATAKTSRRGQRCGHEHDPDHGIGPVLAAKIIGHTGAIARFPSRHHYAGYCGIA